MFIVAQVVRAPADITAAAAVSTKWVPCMGARCVVFEWIATNANALQNGATPAEATNVDPLAAGGGAWSGTPGNIANPVPNVATFALNGTQGGLRCTILPAGSHPFLVNRAIRMNVLGHATLTVTAVSCIAYVIYDDDSVASIGGVAV